jgi:hypothetical protein
MAARVRCAEGKRCSPALVTPAIRRVVAEIDPRLALGPARTLASVYEGSIARERFLMTLLLVFAVVGLSLAVIGVYGVLAQLARRRAREMGIRIALGARSSQVRWLARRRRRCQSSAVVSSGGGCAPEIHRPVRV